MERDELSVNRMFARHNEKCSSAFCTLNLLEDCIVKSIDEGIETSAETMR